MNIDIPVSIDKKVINKYDSDYYYDIYNQTKSIKGTDIILPMIGKMN